MSDAERLFLHARGLNDPAASAAYLAEACGADAALRQQVEALSADADAAAAFFGDGEGTRVDEAMPHPSQASAPAPKPSEGPGTVVGRYTLIEQIGAGGMGVVYLAGQREPVVRQVALKIIKLGMDTQEVVARFEAERQALALMDHPNIARVFDAGATDTGRPYFVMELVNGVPITQFCDEQQLDTRQRLELFIQVCAAVQHAHQKGIIHRDLKPSNILVLSDGEQPVPKVIDFGIAKATDQRLTEKTLFTQLGQFVGTPAYMSPEQAGLSGVDVDTRSDIYSLGVLLYELLVGTTPFDATSLLAAGFEEIRRVIREEEPLKPSTRLNTLAGDELTTVARHRKSDPHRLGLLVRDDLDWIVMKCLEKDRGRRYETANGLAADLKRHLNNEPVVACPPSAAYRFQKAWRRNKLAFSAGAAVTAALVVGLAVSVVALRKARSDRARAEAAEYEESQARKQAEAAGQAAIQERERAQAELWNARLSEARALRIAGGSGARVEAASLVRELVKRSGLTDAQILELRREAIGQLALTDIAAPTNWMPKTSLPPLAWDAGLERYVRHGGQDWLELCAYPTQAVLAVFAGPTDSRVDYARLSPDGEFLAARFENPAGHLWVWRVARQEPVLRADDVGQMEFAADSRSLLLLTSRGVAHQPLSPVGTRRMLQPGRTALAASRSPDLRQIAVVSQASRFTLELWNAASGETEQTIRLDFPAERLAWHPDGTRLAVGGDRGRLEVRTILPSAAGVPAARPPLRLEGHQNFIERLRFAPDGSVLMSYAWDQTSLLWELVAGRLLLREPRFALAGISLDGHQVAALREWPQSEAVARLIPRTGYRTVAWAGQAREAYGVWISPDGRLVVVTCGPTATRTDGECLLWDSRRGVELARLKGNWAAFSADSRTLFTFSEVETHRIQAYDVSEATLAHPPANWFEGTLAYAGQASGRISSGALSADGRTLVVAATDRIIFLDTRGERPPRSWGKTAHAVSLSRDGRWIATMFHHQPAVIWSAADGRPVFWAEPYCRIEFSPDDRWFSVATKSEVQIYDLASRRPAYAALPLEVRDSAPPVAFSPDGLMFAVALNRTHPRLYETATGRELATLSPPHPAPIREKETLKFSPDGQWLLAARSDGETVAWRLPEIRTELAKLGLDWSLPANAANAAGRPPPADYSGLFARPARDPATPRELIDLSFHYNATLTEHWHPGAGSSDLSELPHGLQTLEGVRFDIRGLIQVGGQTRDGRPYPRRAAGITVGFPGQRLHFLHAAINGFHLPRGTPIGSYVVRYADGQRQEIPIAIEREVLDWWAQNPDELSRVRVAWAGKNAASRVGGFTTRLFLTTWENPRPAEVIESLDFVATHPQAAPFLVAVTVD